MVRLKEERAKKRRKDELAMKEQLEKVSEEYAETMLLYDLHMQGEYSKTIHKVERGAAGIPTQTSKLKILKCNIKLHVKSLR